MISFDANSITVTIPVESTVGPVPIIVTNGNGAVAVSSTPFLYTFAPVTAAPVMQPLTPDRGPVTGGTAITISGANFTPGSTVTVGGVPATDVQVFGNTQIVAVTPAGAEGPADVVVTTANGASVPTPQTTFSYEAVAEAVLTCNLTQNDLDGDGAADTWELQYGFNPGDPTDGALDPDNDLQTNAQECAAGTHPRGLYARYLAEGATGAFFDTRVVVANPGVTPAHLLFRFQTETGAVIRAFRVVPAQSRRTIDARLLAGLAAANISTVVESDVQIVVDRTMRWDQVSRFGAHAESSAPAPSLVWYLAEGATHGNFDLFYLLQNPSPTQTAQVQIRYLLPSGSPILQTLDVLPNTRATVYVDQQPGLGAIDVSAVITSLNGVPIIVERAMYSSAAGTFAAGHDSAGVTSPSLDWFFAEGATGGFFDTFLLLANPNGSPANVHATYSAAVGADGAEGLRRARQQPPHPQRAVRGPAAVRHRGLDAAHVHQRRRFPGRALDVVAARPGLVRGPQRRRRDDDRHQVGRRRRRGRPPARGHGDLPARRQHVGFRRHGAGHAAVRERLDHLAGVRGSGRRALQRADPFDGGAGQTRPTCGCRAGRGSARWSRASA